MEAGVDIFNVSEVENTAVIVKRIYDCTAEIALSTTGGRSDYTINKVIAAGANAVSYTLPTTGYLVEEITQKHRLE